MFEAELDVVVRRAIYESFAGTGAAPSAQEITEATDVDIDEVRASLQRLADARVIVLEHTSRAIWMAMPFSGVPTDVITRTRARAYYANCAWDALGIAVALRENATIDASCPDCASPIALLVSAGKVAASDTEVVAHFAVPPRDWWRDIGFT